MLKFPLSQKTAVFQYIYENIYSSFEKKNQAKVAELRKAKLKS